MKMRTAVRVAAATSSFIIAAHCTPAPVGAQEVPVPSETNTGSNATVAHTLHLPLGDKPRPWIASHRGQWRKAPENSIPAILAAIEDGAEIVEIDVNRTKDGHYVLMHDEDVDRTTNGHGKVSDLTLAEIKSLRLREALGKGPSDPTDVTVPTIDEVFDAVKGHNALINLDKGWDYREDLYQKLAERDMVAYGLFKGAPNAQEALDFMHAHPDAQYMHIVHDDTVGQIQEFGDELPPAVEIPWATADEPQGQDAFWNSLDGKTDLFVDTMWNKVSGGYTDEDSLRDPAQGWQYHVDRGADIIQTDDVVDLNLWRDGVDVTKLGLNPGSIRVQAEDYVNDPAFYKDSDPKNECRVPIADPTSPVDACDNEGAYVIQYVRDGEFFHLDANVPQDGEYSLSIRQSSDTAPGGTVTVSTQDGQTRTVDLPNTTENRHYTVEDVGTFDLKQGTNRLKFEFTHPDYLSVDWIQLDPVNEDGAVDPVAPEDSEAELTGPGSSAGGFVGILAAIGALAAVFNIPQIADFLAHLRSFVEGSSHLK